MSVYTFEKPDNWPSLLLYQKITYSFPFVAKYYQKYMDKLKAKLFVKRFCGNKIHVAKVVRILRDENDVTAADINNNYIIKSNFNSGYNVNILPGENITVNSIKQKLEEFTKYNMAPQKQTFFIEEKIDCKYENKNGNAITFIFRCIHSVPYTFSIRNKDLDLQIHYLIDHNCNIKLIDMDYDLTRQQKYTNAVIPDKVNLKKMYHLASILAKPFEFVRMDFYIAKNNDIYFSEYTFFPASGKLNFSNEIEQVLGKKWD
jgi:hypothetical protein